MIRDAAIRVSLFLATADERLLVRSGGSPTRLDAKADERLPDGCHVADTNPPSPPTRSAARDVERVG
jgi:hypothetical protein